MQNEGFEVQNTRGIDFSFFNTSKIIYRQMCLCWTDKIYTGFINCQQLIDQEHDLNQLYIL